jgi:membrane-bound metal-dependent hydrolase YbcI (DUF457 family)
MIYKKLKLPSLIVGSFIPDIEIFIIRLLNIARGSSILPHNRLILHSLFGAMTFGTLISSLVTIYIYPTVVSSIFKIDKEKVSKQCSFSKALMFSSLLGAVSHVLLDVLTHSYNPIFWPFQNYTWNPLIWRLGSRNIITPIYIILGLLSIFIIIKKRDNLSSLLIGE